MVVNTSEGGVFYATGDSSKLTQLAALPNHSHTASEVGALGISTLVNSGSMNDYTTNGIYRFGTDISDAHEEMVGHGNLLVIRGGNYDTLTQLYFNYADGKAFIRSNNVNRLSSTTWNKIAFTSNIPTNYAKFKDGIPYDTSNFVYNYIGYGYSSVGWPTSGPLLTFGANSSYTHFIQGVSAGHNLSHAHVYNGTISSWSTILDSSNYASYCASVGHTHSYLPLEGGTIAGDITMMAANPNNTDQYINFKYSTTDLDNYSWRIGYRGTGSGNANNFVIQSNGSGAWIDALKIGLIDNLVYCNVVGDLTGTASSATNASNIYINNSTSSGSFPLTFVSSTSKGSKTLFVSTGKSLTFNPSTGNLTATTFTGDLAGNATTATSATTATTSLISNKLKCTDSRNTSILPNETTVGIVSDLKTKAITGLTSSYSSVITFRSYGNASDLSGGPVYQIAMDLAGIHSRKSKDSSTWEAWLNILDSSNYTTYCASVGHTHSNYATTASLANYATTASLANYAKFTENIPYDTSNFVYNYIGYGYSSIGWPSNGPLLTFGANSSYTHFIQGWAAGHNLKHAHVYNGTISSWSTILDSSNYASYCASVGHSHSNYYDATVSRTKNTVLAAPNGSTGAATFRALVAADLPTVPVSKGGTGATTLTSGAALIGNGTSAVTTRSIKNMTAKGPVSDFGTALMTTNTLAYWDGAHSANGSSNLSYCNKGAFGTIVTKDIGDYATAEHTHSNYLPVSAYSYTAGCLVRTDIPINSNIMVTFRIEGNSYGAGSTIFTTGHFYNYKDNNTIIKCAATHFGFNFGNINAFCYDGYVHLWFKQAANYQSFIVYVYSTNSGGDCINRVSHITNNAMPSSGVTRLVEITPSKGLDGYLPLSGGTVTGTITAQNFISKSDKRLKTNIKSLPNDSKSLDLNFYEFDYVNNDNHSAGHIAQEVKEVYPELVHGNESETEHLSIDYTGLHSIQIHDLIDYIKRLEKRIIELENKL